MRNIYFFKKNLFMFIYETFIVAKLVNYSCNFESIFRMGYNNFILSKLARNEKQKYTLKMYIKFNNIL